ncbi:hypothetical protein [Mycolicibacterium sp. CBMA 361]|uniref:hypothetical protein n=1 Tax=Mycolicibacterium sp. CBMA 361 TaxID=2606610 RepID=UPI0012DCBCF1|nr:hypothetical protein [Mycolicibacterium sp. CBMA 361]MUM35514.1 hypothetical protein [Mycolicibacterium sp. CBMA 361]
MTICAHRQPAEAQRAGEPGANPPGTGTGPATLTPQLPDCTRAELTGTEPVTGTETSTAHARHQDLRDTEPQRTPWWNRRTAEHQCFCGTPTLTIRNLRVSRHNTEYSDVDLWFHTVHDANAAIRLIAEAQNPFHSRLRRDRRSNLKGALTTSTKWPSFADVYEIYRPLRVA